ncbi:hypothetical protein CK218_11215 [Mesorhizobium sp. WSM3879]|nr:hypothetical protein CK218_11215 [Mesorhizobium sp. WSM3879]
MPAAMMLAAKTADRQRSIGCIVMMTINALVSAFLAGPGDDLPLFDCCGDEAMSAASEGVCLVPSALRSPFRIRLALSATLVFAMFVAVISCQG